MRECYFAVKDESICRRRLPGNRQKLEEARVGHRQEIDIIGFLFHWCYG